VGGGLAREKRGEELKTWHGDPVEMRDKKTNRTGDPPIGRKEWETE